MDWIPIDFSEVFDKHRPYPSQKGSARAIETYFPLERSTGYVLAKETTSKIIQKLFSEEEVDPNYVTEVKRIMGEKLDASPFARLGKVYTIGADQSERESLPAPHINCMINGGIIYKALWDIGAHVSVMSSKLYHEIYSKTLHLAPTLIKLIMRDGRTTKPLGVLRNLDVAIS